MKKYIIIGLLLVLGLSSYAQKKDRLLITGFNDFWLKKPEDIKINGFSPGFDIYLMKGIRFWPSGFSVALGGGVTSHNIHHNSFMSIDSLGRTIFNKIPAQVGTQKIDYDQNKISVTYLGLPVELRYSKDKYRFAVGVRGGVLVSDVRKYKGTDFVVLSNGKVEIKETNIKNMNRFVYGFSGRVGYKFIIFSVFYDMSSIFKSSKSPELTPLSIGFTLIPF